jgi:hypothetical protein
MQSMTCCIGTVSKDFSKIQGRRYMTDNPEPCGNTESKKYEIVFYTNIRQFFSNTKGHRTPKPYQGKYNCNHHKTYQCASRS